MARPLTSHAATAKAVRATLKQAFPTVRFRVRSDSFSGGNSVDIDWTDGPTTHDMESLVGQHEYGHFDGMIDLYEYSNVRDDIPQVKYVMCQRAMSDDAYRALVALVNRKWGANLQLVTKEYNGRTWLELDHETDEHTGYGWRSQEIHREFQATSLLCQDCGAATLPGDAYCPMCGHALTAQDAAA